MLVAFAAAWTLAGLQTLLQRPLLRRESAAVPWMLRKQEGTNLLFHCTIPTTKHHLDSVLQ